MTIVLKADDKRKNADGLSRWALHNTPENTAWDPEDADIFTILGIHVCDFDEAFYEPVRSSYRGKFEILKLVDILNNENSSPELIASLPYSLSKQYSDGKFSIVDELLYYRYRHNSMLVLCDQNKINKIVHESHDNVNSGYLCEDRTIERIEKTAWWPS